LKDEKSNKIKESGIAWHCVVRPLAVEKTAGDPCGEGYAALPREITNTSVASPNRGAMPSMVDSRRRALGIQKPDATSTGTRPQTQATFWVSVVKDFEAAPRSLMGMADAGADASATAPNTAPIKAVLTYACISLPYFSHTVPLHRALSG